MSRDILVEQVTALASKTYRDQPEGKKDWDVAIQTGMSLVKNKRDISQERFGEIYRKAASNLGWRGGKRSHAKAVEPTEKKPPSKQASKKQREEVPQLNFLW